MWHTECRDSSHLQQGPQRRSQQDSEHGAACLNAGYTEEEDIQQSSTEGGIYIDAHLEHKAGCNGTVYAWHFCYFPNVNNTEVAFGAYGKSDESEEVLRPGSYYLHHVESAEESFTCDTITLTESQYFQIYEADSVGACVRESSLRILAEAPSVFRVTVLDSSNVGDCQENTMMAAGTSNNHHETGLALHLYVDISKFIIGKWNSQYCCSPP